MTAKVNVAALDLVFFLYVYVVMSGNDDSVRGRAQGHLRDSGGEGLQDSPGAGLRRPRQPEGHEKVSPPTRRSENKKF